MKWQKERDDLIAQTKAFVQSVTGRAPQAMPGPIFDNPAPSTNLLAAPAPVSPPLLPVQHVVAVNPAAIRPIESVDPMIGLPPVKAAASDFRKEIQTRVAAFQAHQHRFHRERDAYFNSVLRKARAAPEDNPDLPSS